MTLLPHVVAYQALGHNHYAIGPRLPLAVITPGHTRISGHFLMQLYQAI
jgi:hypothetical protein